MPGGPQPEWVYWARFVVNEVPEPFPAELGIKAPYFDHAVNSWICRLHKVEGNKCRSLPFHGGSQLESLWTAMKIFTLQYEYFIYKYGGVLQFEGDRLPATFSLTFLNARWDLAESYIKRHGKTLVPFPVDANDKDFFRPLTTEELRNWVAVAAPNDFEKWDQGKLDWRTISMNMFKRLKWRPFPSPLNVEPALATIQKLARSNRVEVILYEYCILGLETTCAMTVSDLVQRLAEFREKLSPHWIVSDLEATWAVRFGEKGFWVKRRQRKAVS